MLSTDVLGRPLGVLRLSLTARCNLSCTYCLPDSSDPPGLLTLEQRLAVVGAAVGLGVHSLRLTGGEPLLSPQLETLITALQRLRPQGLNDIALTSNGILLSAERAQSLRSAGLNRITLSLDGTTGPSVARMAGLKQSGAGESTLTRVLEAIEHAQHAGFDPQKGALKLNAVIHRGRNDEQLLPLAELARQRGLELRLIEYMDVGNRNSWRPNDVVPATEMLHLIDAQWPLEPLGRQHHSTASRWRYLDGAGTIAVVASVSQPFCSGCNRLRVTADGMAYTCLFASASEGLDLRPWLKDEIKFINLQKAIAQLWHERTDRYSEERQRLPDNNSRQRAEMAYLGG